MVKKQVISMDNILTLTSLTEFNFNVQK